MEALTGTQMIVIGLLLLLAAYSLRRSFVRSERSRNRNVLGELRHDMRRSELHAASSIHQLEVRLHDYGREVEGRLQTQIAKLDQLVLDADRECARLRRLLSDVGRDGAPNRPPDPHRRASGALTGEQQKMVMFLADAGYSAGQIAVLVNRPRDVIQTILDDVPEDRASAA